MAPYFGSSMITWTIIIGVILVAMSLGNFWGGCLADRSDPERRLYQLILWAAIWIALIPVVGKYLIALIAAGAMALFPGSMVLVGSLSSCILLFAFPCMILGAASPCLIKSATRDLENNGRTAGAIYGLSTLGSIFGTFLPTFFTIPVLGTNRTFFLFAGVLGSLSLINALRQGNGGKKPTMICLIILALAVSPLSASFAFWETPLLETESVYNYLQVKREEGVTSLSTHVFVGTQSMFSEKAGLTDLYYDLALLSHYFLKPPPEGQSVPILVLGFATGTFAKLSRQFFPESQIDGVEIDPEIINLGKKYFSLQNEDASVFVEDGRVFLGKTEKKYRIIFLDAFQDVTYPFHMATREFFLKAVERLDDDGVLAINVNMRSRIYPDLAAYVTGTVAGVFPKVLVCTHPDYYNRIIFASKNTKLFDVFSQRIKNLPEGHPLRKLAAEAFTGMADAGKSEFVLTDDLAPVELIGFRMLNQTIKEVFREVLIRVILQLKDQTAI